MAEIENGENESFHEAVNEFEAEEAQLLEGTEAETANQDETVNEDPELEAIKARVREMEEEAEKLKEMQKEVDTQMNMTSPVQAAATGFPTMEEKMDSDSRSVYVGNVDYGATAEELEQHFHGCGSVNRVTILCDKFTGHPKGFAYVEFADKDSVATAQALDESLFRGRQIKVSAKRTNRPGISTTNRKPRGMRGRGTFRGSPYAGYAPRRGRVSRYRRTAFFSPY
ncbi:hypothetical protein FSP39_018965 [Pinctada imbricata]|uniref:RRM domain-containing protein n=1 Tax=Pinctada imbricata TaxID=66713 RepID=A0AA88XPV3_PINIB|nr:hypothetical protein FSP39_018965 [Pinctada imbricata]